MVDRTAGHVVRAPLPRPRRDLTLVGGRRIPAMLLAALIAIVALASAGQAHATLLFASPVINGSTPTAPAELTLVFDEPVSLAGEPVHLRDADGRPVTLDAARVGGGGRVVSAPCPRLWPADSSPSVGRWWLATATRSGVATGSSWAQPSLRLWPDWATS